MTIAPIRQLAMQLKNIIHQITFKSCNIFLVPFAILKNLPRAEQIFNRYDIIVRMNQLFSANSLHTENDTPPPIKLPPILSKSRIAYIFWMQLAKDFPKTSRYTLGNKIDEHFLNMLSYGYLATYQSPAEKILTLTRAVTQLDLVKFFLSIAWESHIIANNHYIILSENLDEIGRMLGGWKKGLEKNEKLPKK